jgi:hypothetical protein
LLLRSAPEAQSAVRQAYQINGRATFWEALRIGQPDAKRLAVTVAAELANEQCRYEHPTSRCAISDTSGTPCNVVATRK